MYNDHRDYLQHARAHKYILKTGKGINARYFYTQQEINAFRNKGQRNSENKSRPDDRPPQYPTLKMPTLKRSGTTTQKKYRPDDRIPSYLNTGQNVRKAGSALKKAGIKAGNKVANERRKKAESLKLAKEETAKRKALKAKKNKDAAARKKAFENQSKYLKTKPNTIGGMVEKKAKSVVKNTKKRVKQKINEHIDNSNRKFTNKQINPNKNNTYYVVGSNNRKTVDYNTFIKEQRKSDGSYLTIDSGNNKSHYIDTSKYDAKQREKAWKARQKAAVKASKAKAAKKKKAARKRKVKSIVNSVIRRG